MRVSATAHLAAFVSSLVLASGCAQSWPTVRSMGDARFMTTGGVRTIDVLPIDIGVGISPAHPEQPDQVARQVAATAVSEVEAQLQVRGYRLDAVMGADGVYRRPDGALAVAMAPSDLDAVLASLAGYGTAEARAGGKLLVPYLPVRLGRTTGADATLYVGGWAYAGTDHHGVTAGDVAKAVIIGLFIVVVIAVIIVAAKHGGGGHGGGGHGIGGVHVSGGGGGHRAIGRGGAAAGRGLGRFGRGGRRAFWGWSHRPDAWGRRHTHVDVFLSAPAERPPADGPSRTALEMTLVDNRSGLVLWHARQQFPGSPTRPADVREAVARMLAGLPASH